MSQLSPLDAILQEFAARLRTWTPQEQEEVLRQIHDDPEHCSGILGLLKPLDISVPLFEFEVGHLKSGKEYLEALQDVGYRVSDGTRAMLQNPRFLCTQTPTLFRAIEANGVHLGWPPSPETTISLGERHMKAAQKGLFILPNDSWCGFALKYRGRLPEGRGIPFATLNPVENARGPAFVRVACAAGQDATHSYPGALDKHYGSVYSFAYGIP